MFEQEMYLFDFEDSPATTDYLGFGRAVGNLAKQISRSNLPLILGLFGRWGAGKSTFLHLLADDIQRQKMQAGGFFTVTFEPWKLEGSTSILQDLVSAIHVRAEEKDATSPGAESVEKKLFMYVEDIGFTSLRDLILSGVGDLAQAHVGIGDQVGELFSRFLRPSPHDLAKRRIEAATLLADTFREYLSSLRMVPVVLIDDLDRCEPDTVVSLFESLKLFLQARESRIVYILAMDHEMIINAVCDRYGFEKWRDGWQYLSKICNQTFFIPRPQIGGLLSNLADELRREHDQLDLFWELLTSHSTEDLLYQCDLYLPRRLKRIVRHTHMALSLQALGLVDSIKQIVQQNREQMPVEDAVAEQACYRVLLGVFMLREAYPEVYSRMAYKTHARRADLMLELGARASRFDTLEERQVATTKLASEWGLSELHPYLEDHVLLDLMAQLFRREEVITGCPLESQEAYEEILRGEILNPVLDILMST
jgi:hypothetical protein